MATFSAGSARAFAFNAVSGSTDSFSPSGTNLAVIGSFGALEFGTPTVLTYIRYGGTGGLDIPEVGAGATYNSGNGQGHIYVLAGVSGGSQTVALDWPAEPLQCMGGAVVYSGADQTTPIVRESSNTGSASGTTTVATVSVPNCAVGQQIGAWFYSNSDTVENGGFTETSSLMPVRVFEASENYCGMAYVSKVATVATETITVNLNVAPGAGNTGWTWLAIPLRINDAAGSAPIAALARNANQFLGAHP